jgi:hypothetical protein
MPKSRDNQRNIFMFRVYAKLFNAIGKYRALHLDAGAVGSEMRRFAHEARWDRTPSERPVTYISRDSAAFPATLKHTKASAIRIMDDRVELEFGGTFLHFGIAAFREGNEGYGVKKLGDGIWYYSEDQSATSR